MASFREDVRPERLVALEEETLALWEREGTFPASVAARAGSPRWVFYDGPPTANGKPGLHHVLSRSIKDFACRLKTMQGFLVERKAGWDTHGLPVEFEAEKRLGLPGKDAIVKFGIAEFNRECRASVFRYLEDWQRNTRRVGYWVDLDAAYVTCSNEYMESLWAILADFHRRGILFRGHKVLPYCPRCETPLSSHEVGLGFKDVQDPSVFVRFRAVGADGADGGESFLVWTTTPWTLPSNVALAVHPEATYAKVRLKEGDGKTEILWLAEPRLAALKAKPEAVEVLERVKGADLVGRRYKRLLDLYDVEQTPSAFTVRPADFVTTEDGTGIVHMSPAYGEDDAAVGRRDRLPVLHPVDKSGRFLPGPRAEAVAGKPVKEADKDLLRLLKQQGSLFRQETVVHSYPHCWRCDTPLLYYARDSWYLRTTAFRERMLEFNRQVAWYPPSTGEGRFGEWLANNVDWAISRERFWGTPLPVWVCDAPRCGTEAAVGSVAELSRLAGRLPEPLDLHRPHVDALTWPCTTKGCPGTMRRTPEIADVWFDSGSMPFAQWHYPFENREKVEREVPAEFVAEAVDQTRGWFYVLLAVTTMYRDRPAYRACVSTDLILDAHGKKMSKSRGNIVEPDALFSKYGADVVRWNLLCSRPLWLPMRFDERDLVETRNRFFNTLASTYSFFALYANADGWAEPEPAASRRPSAVFDRWLLSRLDGLVRRVAEEVASYETARAGRAIVDFVVEDLSNWYVRRNRRRFWKGALSEDKRAAYATLREALSGVSRLMAPFAPFLADAVHRALQPGVSGTGASVHLASWPAPVEGRSDPALEERMEALRTVVSLGHATRNRAGRKVRQPLGSLAVGGASGDVLGFLRENADAVREELNVRRLVFEDDLAARTRFRVALDKKEAARRLGPRTQAVEQALAALPEDEARALVLANGERRVRTKDGEDVALSAGEVRVETVDAEGSASAFGGGLVVRLDTTLTPDLVAEGLVRELVHAVQALRKAAGLAVTDRVRLRWSASGPLAEALRAHRAYVAEELLAVEVLEGPAPEGERVEVDGHEARVRLERAG